MALRALNGVDASSQRIVNVASPTASTDAANKSYVDNVSAGLEWKAAVRAATTTNGTLASAYANGSVIDGVTLATGDRILLKNQTTQTDNGIYTVNASGAPTRAVDANTSASLNNATMFVLSGTVNADTEWTQTTANPVIGTNNVVFAQFAAGVTYTAGSGLQLSSNAFSVLPNGTSIDASGSGIKLSAAAAGTGIAVSGAGVISLAVAQLVKFSATLASGSTSYTVTHSLGTSDVEVFVYDSVTLQQVFPDVTVTSSTVVTIAFGATTANNFRCVVIG
jgi:hypothetical protein